MNRIDQTLAALREVGKSALIPYITAGDPQPEATVGFLQELVSGGADLIELGVPFSDPMADGPVIQAACERALVHHTGLRRVLDMVSDFRMQNDHTPIILMTYCNPIEVMGYADFAKEAAKAGVDGVLIVDLPPEEGESVWPVLKQSGVAPIFLISPTTTLDRVSTICQHAAGYVYYVSLKGVTGANSLDLDSVQSHLEQIRRRCSIPIGVGFGIKDADTAARMAGIADAVIVGSALVSIIGDHVANLDRAGSLLREKAAAMRAAMDNIQPFYLSRAQTT